MNSSLGFVDLPRAERIYIGRQDAQSSSKWYTWDIETDTAHPIPQSALKCYLKGVSVADVESDYGVHTKLKVLISADKDYEIFCGIDTWFAKTLLVALAALSAQDLANPITIGIKAPDPKSKVFFASVFDRANRAVYSEHNWKNDKGELLPFDYLSLVADLDAKLSNIIETTDLQILEAAPETTIPVSASPNSLASLAAAKQASTTISEDEIPF
jgi:hypothetical protein